MIDLRRPGPPRVPARDARRVRAAHGVLRVVVVKPVDVHAQHQGLVRRELVVQPSVEERLAVVARVVEVAIRRQHEGRQRAREERGSILPRVVGRGEEERLVLDDRPADRAGELAQRIRNVHRVDRGERGGRDAGRHGRRAEALGRERLRLHVAGTAHEQSFAVQAVGAGLGDDVQRGAGGPAEFGGKRVREHRHFLDGAERHGGDHRLAAPRLVVVRAVERDRGRAARTRAGDEVGLVDEEIAGALRLPERRIEQRQRRHLAAEDRRLVDLRAVEPAADLRIRAHAFGGAVDGDLRLLGADQRASPSGSRSHPSAA